ncbi:hypothetical protein [Litoribacterium kuwaitense]|uniref:hypothetical protein n=1 Tax=Litoribacterium kuwaitense TaxID=1398745 RepID=UPI001BAAF149
MAWQNQKQKNNAKKGFEKGGGTRKATVVRMLFKTCARGKQKRRETTYIDRSIKLILTLRRRMSFFILQVSQIPKKLSQICGFFKKIATLQ